MLVFVDVGLSPYAIDTNLIENIISEKTKSIMVIRTLGNLFNVNKIKYQLLSL